MLHVLPRLLLRFDIFYSPDRADALGKLGISYGIGMVIGPTVGGWIAKRYSQQSAAYVSAVFSIASLILVMLCIPKNTKAFRQSSEDPSPSRHAGMFTLLLVFLIYI